MPTADLTKYYPHQFSSKGKIAGDSNIALRGIRIPWRLPILDSQDIIRDALPNLFGVGTVTLTALESGGTIEGDQAVGAQYTSDLTDLNSAAAGDSIAMPATEEAAEGDGLLLGFSKTGGPPVGLQVIYSVAGIGGTVQVQYLAKNGTYKVFPKVIDLSAGWTAAAGTYRIGWQIPDDFVPMIESEVSATVERWYVKIAVLTTYSTNPTLSQVQGVCLAAGNIAATFQAPGIGLITHVSYGGTAGATNNDTILQILNWTRKTRGIVTLTGNPAVGRFALSTALYVAAGDELSVQCVQGDGTTEITNFNGFHLEIQP